MASEPDNPFARNSAWPRMPQAPFRVGPLPKAQPAPESAPPPEPPRQAVTPVFTRPTGPAAFSGLVGAAVPRVAPPAPPAIAPQAAVPPQVELVPVPPPASAPVAEEAPPAPPPQPYVEIAPVIVQPLGSGRRAAARKSPAPAIAAGVAGLAAVLGIAYALSRGQEAALKAPSAPPPAAIAAPPAPVVASTPQPAVETPAVEAPAAALPARLAAAPRAPARTRPARLIVPTAPAAADEAVSAPVISLPPPAVVAPQPAPPSQPAYKPPPAPDPNAPVSTKRD